MLFTSEQGEILVIISRCFEQAQAILHAQHAAYSIVNAAHRHFAFFHQLFQVCTETPFIRHHRHIDTGIDSYLDSFFLAACNLIAGVEDIRPVGHNHAVPVQVLFQPLGQQFVVGMERKPVVHGGVHHNRQSTCLDTFEERSEMFLAHILHGDGRRGTIFTGNRHTVTHIMLDASGHLLLSYMVRITALETEYGFAPHFGIHVAIFAIVLPMTGPAGVTCQVEHRSIGPGDTSGLGFISGDAGTFTHQFAVEGSCHIDALREESSTQCISCSVYLVYAINTRNTHDFHRFVLYLPDDFFPLLFGLGNTLGYIQDRADFVFADNGIQQSIVYLKFLGRIITFGNDVNGKLGHLPNLLFKGHLLEQSFYLLFYFPVSWDGRSHCSLRRSGQHQPGEGCG